MKRNALEGKKNILIGLLIALVVTLSVSLVYVSRTRTDISDSSKVRHYLLRVESALAEKNFASTASARDREEGRASRCILYIIEMLNAVLDGDEERAEELADLFIDQCSVP